MLDDDSGFGEITVEICTRTLPQFRSASGENGAIQTAAARGRCRARRIRDKTHEQAPTVFRASSGYADHLLGIIKQSISSMETLQTFREMRH